MRIAVVDVAAETGGAMSVLLDFLEFIQNDDEFCSSQEWLVFTSVKLDISKDNVKSIVVPETKKSWFHRLYWEKIHAIKEFTDRHIDIVLSLQNTAFKKGNYRQIVYFHNVLLLENPKKYSLFKAAECKYAVYTKFISRYTLRSLHNTDYVIAQTETVKNDLLHHENGLNIVVVRPNVHLDEKYRNTAQLPVKGLIYPTSPVPFKRVEEIVRCVKEYHDWFIEHKLKVLVTLSGDENEYAKSIKQEVDGITDVIQLIGFQKREKLFELYQNYALFICSELESFPIPFTEAAFTGTPIVAARYPYAEDSIRNANSVFLYNPKDIQSLMECIKKVAEIGELKKNNIDFSEDTWRQVAALMIQN